MRWRKVILKIFLVIVFVFVISGDTVLAVGYTDAQLRAQGVPDDAANYTDNQEFEGYYEGNDGLNYPIGDPAVPHNGDGPAGPVEIH